MRKHAGGAPGPLEEIGSVHCEPNQEIQAGSVGEGAEIPVARKERNPATNTALGDQGIVETRPLALSQYLRSYRNAKLQHILALGWIW